MRTQSIVINSEFDDVLDGRVYADKLTIETEHDDAYVELILEKDGSKVQFYCDRSILMDELHASHLFALRCKEYDDKKKGDRP